MCLRKDETHGQVKLLMCTLMCWGWYARAIGMRMHRCGSLADKQSTADLEGCQPCHGGEDCDFHASEAHVRSAEVQQL